jgi:hypothetical protein
MYTRKCHKETPRVAILNKEKSHFFSFYKIGEQEGKTGSAWSVHISGRQRKWRKGLGG